MAMFNSKLLNYQKVSTINHHKPDSEPSSLMLFPPFYMVDPLVQSHGLIQSLPINPIKPRMLILTPNKKKQLDLMLKSHENIPLCTRWQFNKSIENSAFFNWQLIYFNVPLTITYHKYGE